MIERMIQLQLSAVHPWPEANGPSGALVQQEYPRLIQQIIRLTWMALRMAALSLIASVLILIRG